MKNNALFIFALICANLLWAQKDSIVSMSDGIMRHKAVVGSSLSEPNRSHLRDSLSPWEYHLSMGGGVVGSNFGSASAFAITPSVIYRPNSKFTFRSSATFLHSYTLAPGGYEIRGRRERSMAPLRNPEATAMALSLSASYKATDRLWLAGRVMFLNGALASGILANPWFANDGAVELDATAVTAAMRYRLWNESFIEIHMTYIKDRTGALGPLLFGGPYGSPAYYDATTFGGHLF